MTAADFLPSLRALPRSEKLHLIQLLAGDLASDEGSASNEPIALLPTDQCPYTPAELSKMRNEPGGRTLAEIRQSLGMV